MTKLEPIELPNGVVTARTESQQENGLSLPQKLISFAGNKKFATERKPEENVMAAGPRPAPAVVSEDQVNYFDYNMHSVKKAVSSGLLDVALLMANVSQLKTIYLAGHSHPFYTALMTLLIISIITQVFVGVFLIILSRININEPNERNHRIAEALNTAIFMTVFLLTLTNIFISAIGISATEQAKAPIVTTTSPTSGRISLESQ